MKLKLTTWIMIGMILGIIVGYICNVIAPDAKAAKDIAGYFNVVTDIFLRLIKMIIAPLVFATLVSGIATMGDASAVGRIGLKAMLWFILASLVSLGLGLIMVDLLQPGANLALPLPEAGAATNLKTGSLNLKDFITNVFPKSVFEAMTNNNILQILVFSIFFGFAIASLKGKQAATLVGWIDERVAVSGVKLDPAVLARIDAALGAPAAASRPA